MNETHTPMSRELLEHHEKERHAHATRALRNGVTIVFLTVGAEAAGVALWVLGGKL